MHTALDFEALFGISPNPYMVLDAELRYVAANAAYLQVTASRLEDLLGRRVLEVFPNDPHDPNNASARMLLESLQRVIRERRTDTLALIPYRVPKHTAGGVVLEERFWSATHTPLLDARGEVAFILQHTVDVTELQRLKESAQAAPGQVTAGQITAPPASIEAGVLSRAQVVQQANRLLDEQRRHLLQLFEEAPGFVAFLRGRGHVFELANAAYLRHMGRSDLLGRPIREALPELEGQRVFELLDRVFESGEPFVGREMKLLLHRGDREPLEERFVDFLYQPIRGADGRVTGILVQGHDVTERKKSEEERERFFQLAPDMLCVAGVDGRFHRVNAAFPRTLGWTAEELLEQPFVSFVHPEDVAATEAEVQKLSRGIPTIRFENRYRSRDGTWKWLAWAATPVPELGIIYAAARDITEERRIQQALRASERQFQTLADSIPQLAWIAEADGSIHWYNRRWYAYTGTTPDEMADESGWGWKKVHDPEVLPRVLENFRAALASGEPWEDAFPLRRSDGELRWHLSRAMPLRDESGNVVRWFGTNTDVEEQRRAELALIESEARFRNMADSAPVMLWVTDRTGSCTYLSRQWYEFTAQSEEEGLGLGWVSAIHPEDAARAEGAFLEAHAGHQPYRVEFRLRRHDGVYRWALDSATPRFGPDGGYLGFIGSVIDIDERKQVEEAQRRHSEELQKAVQTRDVFLSVASHELRTPLTALSLRLAHMKRSAERARPAGPSQPPAQTQPPAPSPSPRREITELEIAEAQVRRLAVLVESLLNVSRLDEGGLTLALEEIDLTEVVREAVGSMEPEAARAGCPIRLALSGPVNGLFDPVRVGQVVTNLLTNAIKFGAGRPVLVEVDADAERVRLCVRDEGIGIAEEDFERIFNRFERAVSARHYGGLGLGLYVIRQVVDAMRGTVSVESRPGRGATFTVELPRLGAESAPADREERGEPERA